MLAGNPGGTRVPGTGEPRGGPVAQISAGDTAFVLLSAALVLFMTPGLALLLFALTIGMCALAAVSAIFKVTRIDPAGVFSR